MPVLPYEDSQPQLGELAFVAPNAWVIGDVELGDEASVWYHATVRGDVFPIEIGPRANLQDGCVVHVTTGRHATRIEHDVTVGHGAILHGCHVEHHALVGIGATILDGARIGAYTMVAAGALVTPGQTLPAGVLAMGMPARVVRELTDDERSNLDHSAAHYVQLAARHRRELARAGHLAGARASEEEA